MINLRTKYEVSMFTHYKDMKGNTKCRNYGGLCIRGNPRSPAMSAFDRVHATFYSTIMETMHLPYTVSSYSELFVKVADFNLPHLHLATLLGVFRSNFTEIFGFRKLESLGYRFVLFA